MDRNEEALNNVRRRISEWMNKADDKIQVGWRPASSVHSNRAEGEVWTDGDGKEWTKKNGVIQSVTKLDGAKNPIWCPKCSKPLNHRFDKKFMNMRNHCYDCNIAYEGKIRRAGRWEEFERSVLIKNYIGRLRDEIARLKEYKETVSAPEYINADDSQILMVERWNVDLDKVRADLQADIDQLEAALAKTIEEHGTGELSEDFHRAVESVQ